MYETETETETFEERVQRILGESDIEIRANFKGDRAIIWAPLIVACSTCLDQRGRTNAREWGPNMVFQDPARDFMDHAPVQAGCGCGGGEDAPRAYVEDATDSGTEAGIREAVARIETEFADEGAWYAEAVYRLSPVSYLQGVVDELRAEMTGASDDALAVAVGDRLNGSDEIGVLWGAEASGGVVTVSIVGPGENPLAPQFSLDGSKSFTL
ncbi:hypothetical protein [Tsukamurella paurometabola]|uniref:Uncharacterized protein n=1 Tax=Tsukamurella paurometabola TaxID=2061 RepID=A0ABS5NGM0_TSUPA|nr:hypothetical protein [Tsukamurella paurometabola]MBS4102757.1 hypothetical protein [Tsukamurella paurometabola]